MMKFRCTLAAVAALLLTWTTPAMSQSEWQVINTVKLNQKPADMLVSADKSRIYILTEKGQIQIYGANGQLKDTIEVGGGVDQIQAGPGNDTLFLLNRDKATVQMVRISIIETIDTTHAPYKGKEKAEVTVVVFSDFQ